MKISNHFIKADQVCDFIPVVSTVSNLINIILKCALNIFKGFGGKIENEYFKHLDRKPFAGCVLMAIPFAGIITAVAAGLLAGAIFSP